MIGKELLSEVFTDNQQNFKVNKIEKNILHYSWLMEEFFGDGDVNCKWIDMSINIYELAHKCKEWAISKGFITHSVRNLKEYVVYLSGDFREPSDDFRCNSEPEAIIKACEWILKEIKK